MTLLPVMEARDLEDHLSKQLCSNCDTSPTKFWCLDCNGSLCGDCELAHRRVSLTRSHRLGNQPQSVKFPGSGTPAPVKYCQLHMLEPLELYCFTCEQLTCKDCQLTTHRNHSFEFVSKAMAAVRRQLQTNVLPISAQRDTLMKTMQCMESRLESIQLNKADVRGSLLACYFKVVHDLKDKVTKVYQDILDVFKLESDHIDTRLKELKLLQLKYVRLTENSEKCKTISDLQTLMNMKKQLECQLKDIQDQDLRPPSTMSHVVVKSNLNLMNIMDNFAEAPNRLKPGDDVMSADISVQLEVSWIPFSVPKSSCRRSEPPPANPDVTLHTSTSYKYSSFHNHKTGGSNPPTSSSNPSSSSFAPPPQTSSSTNLAQSGETPIHSTTTSRATTLLPPVGPSYIPISGSSHVPKVLKHCTQKASKRSAHSSTSSFPTFTSSLPATSAPLVMPSAEQLKSTSVTVQPSSFISSVVPHLYNPALTIQTPLLQTRPTQAPVAPPQKAGTRQNQLPAVHQTTSSGACSPILCLTNRYTSPTVLIPAHTQFVWLPAYPSSLPTMLPPPYPSQTSYVDVSVCQLGVGETILNSLGPVPSNQQTLPVTGNLVSLSGPPVLQPALLNQDPFPLTRAPASQKDTFKIGDHLLKKPTRCLLRKPAGNTPTTTVLQQTEPEQDEPTSTFPEQLDHVENEPTSTTADKIDGQEDEPSTTTCVEEDAKLITSTSGDLGFAKAPETPNTNEEPSCPVIGQQCSNSDTRQLRLSLVRLPITPPIPGSLFPSFRLVHGDIENEIYLMEVKRSPTKAISEVDDIGLPTKVVSGVDDIRETTITSEFDFTEPLSSPESDLSVQILSCSVCVCSDSLLICSACARGFHRECHIPPMGPDIVPGWICSLCQDLSDPSDAYISMRPCDSPKRGLELRDQRRCETLLLFLKVEGCSRLTEFDHWSLLEPVSERLQLRLEPPYETTLDFISDVWMVFRDVSRDDALRNLKKCFRKKIKKVLGIEKRCLQILLSRVKEDQSETRHKQSHFRKRLGTSLDNQTPKKMKKTTKTNLEEI